MKTPSEEAQVGAPGWVQGGPWSPVSPPGPRDGAERREPREGGAWPRLVTPWGGAPESPPFHSPPTLSPTAESSEDRKARGLLKWWVWMDPPGVPWGTERMRTDGRFQHCLGLACRDHRSSFSAPEGRGLQSWVWLPPEAPRGLPLPPAAPGGRRVLGSRPQHASRCLRLRSGSVAFPGCLL